MGENNIELVETSKTTWVENIRLKIKSYTKCKQKFLFLFIHLQMKSFVFSELINDLFVSTIKTMIC